MKRALRTVATLAVAFAISACQADKAPPESEGVPAGITGINHTRTFIAAFYVDSAWGGNIASVTDGGGGGSTTCCVVLPRHYRSGLSAKVRWNHTESVVDHWKETVAPILPYPDGAGRLWVNFLPDDRVVILVSNMPNWSSGYHGDYKAPEHPEYRGAEVEFPRGETKQ